MSGISSGTDGVGTIFHAPTDPAECTLYIEVGEDIEDSPDAGFEVVSTLRAPVPVVWSMAIDDAILPVNVERQHERCPVSGWPVVYSGFVQRAPFSGAAY
jgi:hypothetical protein